MEKYSAKLDPTVIQQPRDLANYIDHTLLKADATPADIQKLCNEATEFQFKAVCVNPIFVQNAADFLRNTQVQVASVVGFPLGAHRSQIKAAETLQAIDDGADEIDMVMRLDFAKQNMFDDLQKDIQLVVQAAQGKIVKVILETGLLSQDEIAKSCHAAELAGAHFVKTSTGFLGRGASLEDILLMRQSCSSRMQIKASGGIKTFEQAKALVEAGATRLGTSSGVALVSIGSTSSNGY